MASLSFLSTTQTAPLHHPRKPHQPSPTCIARTRRFHTSCNSTSSNNTTPNTTNTTDTSTKRGVPGSGSGSGSPLRLDRRNVLLGLGGLYGATSLPGREKIALGAPISPPDLSKCHLADGGTGVGNVQCCPPYSSDTVPIDYQFPASSKPLRIRRPAHLLEKEEIEKYKEAIAKMRELTTTDPSDPRGWMQQANVHCQYCNGAYDQVGYDNVRLQVHFSWLFLPWHRWYLHFYERILGNLIGDDSFALPYWNWDTPLGMYAPSIFVDTTSSLYDENRNLSHYPPAVLDYKYAYGDAVPSTEEAVQEVVNQNLLELSKTYKESLTLPELFMGDPIRAGEATETDTEASSGRLEIIHNGVHQWTGPDTVPYMDMGNFYSAGRDPIFYCHHSNVDRMWQIYRSMRGNKTEFKDDDWLNSSFLFVDENKQLVKVKVQDCFNPLKLKYSYEEVELPWAEVGIRKKLTKVTAKAKTLSLIKVSEFGSDPKTLDKATIRVLVTRPKKSRSKTEKEGAVEVLIIKGIQAPIFEPSRFDVYITTPYEGDLVAPSLGEFAGSFTKLPHHGSGKDTGATKTKKSKLKLGINNLLEDIDAEGAEKLVVSLVPRLGQVTVGGVSIDLLNT
ncbi:hypothetical protein MRB53_022484 [Persea americana]|uniref:Uncharacterized protein n=1 Tax=Persea americana TaxID=3435 RepID=A0ACC2L6Z2_PERAE|nr:hypothetical protein MRB53_022484 [Persea americana]